MDTPCKAGLIPESCVIENKVCKYCKRTLEEISNWLSYSTEKRTEIINRIKTEDLNLS